MFLFFDQDPYLDRLSLYRKTDCKCFLDAPYNNNSRSILVYLTNIVTNQCMRHFFIRNVFLSDVHQVSSPPVIPPVGQPCNKYTLLLPDGISKVYYTSWNNSHFTCNLHVFSFPVTKVYSSSKDLLRSKIVQQLKIFKP